MQNFIQITNFDAYGTNYAQAMLIENGKFSGHSVGLTKEIAVDNLAMHNNSNLNVDELEVIEQKQHNITLNTHGIDVELMNKIIDAMRFINANYGKGDIQYIQTNVYCKETNSFSGKVNRKLQYGYSKVSFSFKNDTVYFCQHQKRIK